MTACSSAAGVGSTAPAGFTNPVYDQNFPDPMIISDPAGGFWAVSTNGNGSNVQTLRSTDLVSWEQGPDALPELPEWSTPGKVWAPEVITLGSGYAMYYTTIAPDPAIQCVGVALSERPEGPYTDDSDEPLICEADQGGSIDAHPFVDSDGKRYLYWKNDGNAVGVDTYLSVAELDDAGTSLPGKPRRLFKQDLPWEGDLVEGPFVWKRDGRYHLFYSANSYASADYAVGHAVADSPLGPFTKDPDPVLATNDVAAGPGHCALFERAGRVWMVYHAWAPGEIGGDYPGRTMWLSEVTFGNDDSVAVVPPTVAYPTRP
ncbi:MAG TPA: glycoside hydrolase family 43 protein [Propionibacteriaceae bacterium]